MRILKFSLLLYLLYSLGKLNGFHINKYFGLTTNAMILFCLIYADISTLQNITRYNIYLYGYYHMPAWYIQKHSRSILVPTPAEAANKPFGQNTERFTRKAILSNRAVHLLFVLMFIPFLLPSLLDTDKYYLSRNHRSSTALKSRFLSYVSNTNI